LVQVDEAWSSKTCSQCGGVHYGLGASEVYRCTNADCGLVAERDTQSAKNILAHGLSLLESLAPQRTDGDSKLTEQLAALKQELEAERAEVQVARRRRDPSAAGDRRDGDDAPAGGTVTVDLGAAPGDCSTGHGGPAPSDPESHWRPQSSSSQAAAVASRAGVPAVPASPALRWPPA